MSKSTRAEILRQAGNNIYMSLDYNLAPAIFDGRAAEAITAYRNSLLSSNNDMDKAKALKNISSTELRIHGYRVQRGTTDRKYLSEAASNLYAALSLPTITAEWRDQNIPSLERILDDVLQNITEGHEEKQRAIDWLLNFLNEVRPNGGLSNEKVHSLYTCIIGDIIMDHVRCLESGDFKGAAVIKNCNGLLIKAGSFCTDEVHTKRLEELKDSVHLQLCLLESQQTLKTANQMLVLALEDETPSIEMFWEIIDMYRHVIVLTREKVVEVEAEACSHTGKIFRVVFHDNVRAKTYYKLCVHLCLSLAPKMMDSEWWYQECIEANKVFQLEDDRLAEEARLRDTAVVREELKAELEELNGKKSLGAQDLMKWVFERHPPKVAGATLGVLAADTAPDVVKKELLKMIRHYHPDRNGNEDAKWRYLCGQITAILNAKYEYYK